MSSLMICIPNLILFEW